MGLIWRILWAVAVAVVAWLICLYLGGLLATAGQPQLDYTGNFMVAQKNVIAIGALVVAFVLGPPARFTHL